MRHDGISFRAAHEIVALVVDYMITHNKKAMLYPTELRAARPLSKRGRGEGIRTPDILLPKQARYRTALHPASSAKQHYA